MRSRFSRGPTRSGATETAEPVAPAVQAAHQTPVSRFRQRSRTCRSCGSSLGAISEYDVAIIGGGAAGLSAALVLSRARRKVLVVDAGAPRNAPALQMQGFLSRDGLAPSELLAIGRHEVQGYGGEIVEATATDLVRDGTEGFWVLLADGRRISARRLLVTTGLRDELQDIPGLRERWARDVLHCPYCHGHEVPHEDGLGAASTTRGRDAMRAIVQDGYGPVDRWRLTEIARPEIADTGVLVKVHAAGIDRVRRRRRSLRHR